MPDYKHREIPVLDDIISTAVDSNKQKGDTISIDTEPSDELFITAIDGPVLTLPEAIDGDETRHFAVHRIEPAIGTNLNPNTNPEPVVEHPAKLDKTETPLSRTAAPTNLLYHYSPEENINPEMETDGLYTMGSHQLETNYAHYNPSHHPIENQPLAETENKIATDIHGINFDIEAITEQIIQQILPNIEQQLRLLVHDALSTNIKTSAPE